MVTIKDVSARAEVSISTISNVLNKTKYVSPKLIKKVELAVIELGYEVNPIAASMKKHKSGSIGIITEDICGLFYPYVIRGIESVANQKGYNLIICDVNSRDSNTSVLEREQELFYKLLLNRVDGIIFVSSISEVGNDNYFIELKKNADNKYKKTPIVSLERDLTKLGIDSIYFNNLDNSEKATNHLIECGCKNICHIAGPRELLITQERINGYKNSLSNNNLLLNKEKMIVHGDYSHQSGYFAMEKLLNQVKNLDGVFCGNDQMAVGALKLLKKKNKKVPEEIKIIGHDNVFISGIVEPGISTIHIQKKEAGIKAAEILFNRIENQLDNQIPIGVELESSLVIRKSTSDITLEDEDLNNW
ncbi:MAG: LacI family DNA-binding transcriptional regulator [Fusobacteriaceae bacterium]